MKLSLEVFGRGCICILVIILINLTEWYQSLSWNPKDNIGEPLVWIISFSLMGMITWVILPLFTNPKIKEGEKDEN